MLLRHTDCSGVITGGAIRNMNGATFVTNFEATTAMFRTYISCWTGSSTVVCDRVVLFLTPDGPGSARADEAADVMQIHALGEPHSTQGKWMTILVQL
jgi:hypothetical protein